MARLSPPDGGAPSVRAACRSARVTPGRGSGHHSPVQWSRLSWWFAVSVPLVLGAEARADAGPVLLDRVVARIEGRPLFRSDVLRFVRPELARLEPAARADAAVVARWQRRAFDSLVQQRMIAIDCERSGVAVAEEDVDALVVRMAKDLGLDQATLLADVAKQGFTVAEWRERLRAELLLVKWSTRKAERAAESGEPPFDRSRALASLERDLVVERRW